MRKKYIELSGILSLLENLSAGKTSYASSFL